jgi:hypothetical protein
MELNFCIIFVSHHKGKGKCRGLLLVNATIGLHLVWGLVFGKRSASYNDNKCSWCYGFCIHCNVKEDCGLQYSRINKRHFLYSAYYELTAFTCLVHNLLTFNQRCINNNWYIVCVGYYVGWLLPSLGWCSQLT